MRSWRRSRALALTVSLASFALTACDESEQFITHDEAVDISDGSIEASGMRSEIDDLKTRLEAVEEELEIAKISIDLNAEDTDALRGTVNKNANVSNSNAVAAMTRRAACGRTPYVTDPNTGRMTGGQPIKCTEDDLR